MPSLISVLIVLVLLAIVAAVIVGLRRSVVDEEFEDFDGRETNKFNESE